VAGSRAYGTATADSDEDLRGVYAVPARAYLALQTPPAQINDPSNNEVYLSLRRCIELLAAGNPSVMELLYMPADCRRLSTPAWQQLERAAPVFITHRCVEAHLGYAYTQIKKARGQNKWINQPKPATPPARVDYCHLLPADALCGATLPGRPLKIATAGVDLAQCHVARVDHAPGLYRLYRVGASARGVFRDDQIVCQSIPLDAERDRFVGLLIDNEAGWRQAVNDHHNYWTWRRERNEARWRQQERGELDYDAKNLMHTVRLLLSGESILRHGRPLVRFDGEALALLMRIRLGQYRYEQVLDIADAIRDRCETLKAQSTLPPDCCGAIADDLLQEVTMIWEQTHASGD
jgi:hypothetical protein